MTRMLHRYLIAVTLVGPACGGGTSSAAPSIPTTPSNVLAVAGTYPTRATVIADRNTCGSVTVQDNQSDDGQPRCRDD